MKHLIEPDEKNRNDDYLFPNAQETVGQYRITLLPGCRYEKFDPDLIQIVHRR